jgi:hypothetical protein
MLLHHVKMPVAFLWTPKAGCTSLVRWFFFHTGDLDAALAYNPFVHRYRQAIFMKRPGYFLESVELMLRGEVPVIKLVRNPYDRSVSSFAQLLRLQRAPSGAWARKLRNLILSRIGETAPKHCLSFDQFLRGVAAIGPGSARLNRHVASQYHMGEDQLRDRIVKLEHFASQIGAIEGEFRLPPSPMAMITGSSHHRSKVAADAGSLARALVSSADFPPDATPSYEAFYDAGTRRLAALIFQADFRAYDYPF